jgi:hypothetical protein
VSSALRPGEKQRWSPKVLAKQITPPILWDMLAGRK